MSNFNHQTHNNFKSNYMNNRSQKHSPHSLNITIKLEAFSHLFACLRKNLLAAQKSAFQVIFNHRTSKNQPAFSNKIVNLHAQFVNHCATVIQSHFKRYIQQKRYLQFLPIYRRFRELLYAGFQGWKVRKIMKLPPIKAQIKSIKEKNKNKQASMVRIFKRQLVDEIERLGKKGKWVEIEEKSKNNRRNSSRIESKQNISLYGNVKSKSIKNIFKEQIPRKNEKDKEKRKNINPNPHNNSVVKEVKHRQIKITSKNQDPSSKKIFNPDEIQIKGQKDFYALLQQKCRLSISQEQIQKKIIKPPLKKQNKGQNLLLYQSQKIHSKQSTQICSRESLNQNSQIKREQKQVLEDKCYMTGQNSIGNQSNSIESSIEIDSLPNKRTKLNKPKKIKITLTSSTIDRSSTQRANSETHSIIQQHFQHLQLKENIEEQLLQQRLMKINSKKKLTCVSELIKIYEEVYRKKKEQIGKKIKNLNLQQQNSIKISAQQFLAKQK